MQALYTVKDITTDEIILDRATGEEIEDTLGFRPRLPKYVEGAYHHGRYYVEKIGESKACIPGDLLKQWEEVNIAAELLRTGQGKIVSRIENGKRIKFVEPKGART